MGDDNVSTRRCPSDGRSPPPYDPGMTGLVISGLVGGLMTAGILGFDWGSNPWYVAVMVGAAGVTALKLKLYNRERRQGETSDRKEPDT